MLVTLRITPKTNSGVIPVDLWDMEFFGEQLDPEDEYDITVVSIRDEDGQP